ncbi:MAG: ABZJ_00895 family protein [Paracoccus sp. (in: a-proteobacteria)]|nr:ABZJ_00895 family protein [Paracoccus sp. (in: a-proteobacteria)]
MTNLNNATDASMIRLILIYAVYFIFGVVVAFGVSMAIAGISGGGIPLYVVALIVPMLAAMQAGGSYVRQAGRAAGFGYSLIFGLLTAGLVLAVVLIAGQSGVLDAMLAQIDPYAMQNGMRMRALSPVLILTGGLALFCNTMMFWAMTKGEMKRKLKREAGGR